MGVGNFCWAIYPLLLGVATMGGWLAQATVKLLGLTFFQPTVFFSIFTLFCLPSFSVSLPYFNLCFACASVQENPSA